MKLTPNLCPFHFPSKKRLKEISSPLPTNQHTCILWCLPSKQNILHAEQINILQSPLTLKNKIKIDILNSVYLVGNHGFWVSSQYLDKTLVTLIINLVCQQEGPSPSTKSKITSTHSKLKEQTSSPT